MIKKYIYNINNLDCAHCAQKIENELNKDYRLKNVKVNFATSKLSYEANENISLKEINKIIEKIEFGVTITETELKAKKEYHLVTLILGIFLGICGIQLNSNYIIGEILILISYIILLYKTFLNAINMLIKNRTINENLLLVISCTGAYIIGENFEGIMVISLYLMGKILEEKAINNSRNSVKKIIDLKEIYANKIVKGKIEKVEVEELKINDVILIKKGDKIPNDGIIVKGSTYLDTTSLTGESKLKKVGEQDQILSGCINKGDVIEVKVTSEFKDSTVSKILALLEEATEKKAKLETKVSKLSRIYTPTVLILSILIAVLLPIITSVNYQDSLYRALTFLVISCPCAIAISVPLSYFTGIGVSSQNGILIKGSNYLDNLANVKKIVFDKTGTVTTGKFAVTNIEIFDKNYSEEELTEILIQGEQNSNHPIAESILKLSNKKLDNSKLKNYREISGKGISYMLENNQIKVGNNKICNCKYDAILHLNINDKHVASITIGDEIKKEASKVIGKIKKLGIKTYMFTGDNKENAQYIIDNINLDGVKYELLPQDKYYEYEKIKENNEIVAFVGDGINDAPVLKRADIGISMGTLGSESAVEASDIVISNDNLNKITLAIDISKYTLKIIKQNLFFAIFIKIFILLLSTFGIAKMWFAVFADTGVTLITIINTLRIMNKFKNK
jgi:Cd2+/Zn2+-exporting ATPase